MTKVIADNNTTVGEAYAALSLNKDAVGGSIVATNTTVNVTAGSDSNKGRNGAENGTVTANGTSQILQKDGGTVATSADGSVVVSVMSGKIVVTSVESEVVVEDGVIVAVNGNGDILTDDETVDVAVVEDTTETEIGVDVSADAEAPKVLKDQVRSWVVVNGQTLREVLQSWADKEGWDLVWTTAREYPIEASAVFKGRFVDVAAALVRNFGRATPVPYAKFYKGNRVLVISTVDE